MKKTFLTLMAVAAITMTSCDRSNNPYDPNHGKDDPTVVVKTGAIAVITAVSDDWLKIADFYVYDSINSKTTQAANITDIYATIESIKAEVRTEAFEGATAYKGCYQNLDLRSDTEMSIRCVITLKDNYIDILKEMKPEQDMILTSLIAAGMQSSAPMFYGNESSHTFPVETLLKMIETSPGHIESIAKQAGRSISKTIKTDGSSIGIE